MITSQEPLGKELLCTRKTTILEHIVRFFRGIIYRYFHKTNMYKHAEDELKRTGLLNKGSDYDGAIGKAVLKLMKAHCNQGHSGFSSSYTVHIFSELVAGRALTPLTNDPEEWFKFDKDMLGHECWQSKRSYSCFSDDNLKTYYDIDEKDKPKHELKSKEKIKADTTSAEDIK